jgi:hypothetical protein
MVGGAVNEMAMKAAPPSEPTRIRFDRVNIGVPFQRQRLIFTGLFGIKTTEARAAVT